MDAYVWAPSFVHPLELLGKSTKYAKVEATKESKTAKERMTESSLVGERELERYLKGFVKSR